MPDWKKLAEFMFIVIVPSDGHRVIAVADAVLSELKKPMRPLTEFNASWHFKGYILSENNV